MSRTIKQVRLEYNEKNLVLDETFPNELEGILDEPEFEAVVRKINLELNQDILEIREEMRKWAKVFACSAFLVVGLVFTPVVMVKSNRYKQALEAYWGQIEAYLKQVTKKSVAKRKDKWVEWKLNQSGHGKRGRDVFDPNFTWQVYIVVKARTKKGAAYVPKQLSKAPLGFDGDADTSITGFEGEKSSGPSTLPDFSGIDKRVSFVTPEETGGASTSAKAMAGTAAVGASAAIGAAALASALSEEDAAEKRVSAASTLSVLPMVDEEKPEDTLTPVVVVPDEGENRLSAASTLSPVDLGSQRQTLMSIDAVNLADDKRSSVVSRSSIIPIAAEDRRMSALSIAPIASEGIPGDRSSSLSLTPILVPEAEEKATLPTVVEAPTEEEQTTKEAVLSPVMSSTEDESVPEVVPNEESDQEFPVMPDEDSIVKAEEASVESIQAVILPKEDQAEDGPAEDGPEDFPAPVITDSESGSII